MRLITKNIIKRSCKGILGGVIGSAISTISIPSQIGKDLTAPISYPLYGLTVGAMIGTVQAITSNSTGKDTAILIGANTLSGLIGSSLVIPMAPLLAPTRPVTMPITGFVFGATIGFFSEEIIEKAKEIL